jgi:Raf kinase inhibitor-like YbhB/YbcL family protein
MNGFFLVSFFVAAAAVGNAAAFEIKSGAFHNNGRIPAKYTAESLNVSPPLFWSNAPSGTKSFALICEDPDAPSKVWVHWVIYNIPKDSNGLGENVPKQEVLPDGTTQVVNDSGKTEYDGPYPPPGKPHRYFFKLYALDTTLNPGRKATKADIERAMKSHVLAETGIIGLYQRH